MPAPCSLLVAEAAAAEKKCDDPLPNVTIAAPASDVPEQFAAFSGVWKGKWGNWLCSRLAFEEVAKDGAVKVIYSWGKVPGSQPGYERYGSTIKDGKIKFGTYAKFTFEMNSNGDLVGERRWRTQRDSVVMFKVGNE